MKATSLNHVSISAPNLEESLRFYTELFGLEQVPTPNFGFPVRWLRIGDLQLHLFERPNPAPSHHHLAVTVDDFQAVYLRAKEMGILDQGAFGHHIYELPDNNVQMYVRDPGGNLIEIDWPDVNKLDRSIVTDIRPLANPQQAENLRATLFLKPESGVRA